MYVCMCVCMYVCMCVCRCVCVCVGGLWFLKGGVVISLGAHCRQRRIQEFERGGVEFELG